MATSIPEEQLRQLRDRQIAFFQVRLVTERAKQEWSANLSACYRALLKAPFATLVDASALVDAVDAALSDEALERAARPLSSAIAAGVVKALREDRTLLGAYVPLATRAKIDSVLERPNLVDDRFIRAVVEQDAVEEVMQSILYETIKTFNDRVNPVFAEWGILSLLKRFLPLGFGTLSKAIEGARTEFEKRLEPEIQKFLKGFSRQALHTMAGFVIAKKDEPKFIALRKEIAVFLYGERLADLTASADEELTRMVHEAVLDIVAHVSAMPAVRAQRRAILSSFVERHAGDSLESVLACYGITHPPEVSVFAMATWPALVAALKSEPVRRYLADLVEESYGDFAAGGELAQG